MTLTSLFEARYDAEEELREQAAAGLMMTFVLFVAIFGIFAILVLTGCAGGGSASLPAVPPALPVRPVAAPTVRPVPSPVASPVAVLASPVPSAVPSAIPSAVPSPTSTPVETPSAGSCALTVLGCQFSTPSPTPAPTFCYGSISFPDGTSASNVCWTVATATTQQCFQYYGFTLGTNGAQQKTACYLPPPVSQWAAYSGSPNGTTVYAPISGSSSVAVPSPTS